MCTVNGWKFLSYNFWHEKYGHMENRLLINYWLTEKVVRGWCCCGLLMYRNKSNEKGHSPLSIDLYQWWKLISPPTWEHGWDINLRASISSQHNSSIFWNAIKRETFLLTVIVFPSSPLSTFLLVCKQLKYFLATELDVNQVFSATIARDTNKWKKKSLFSLHVPWRERFFYFN